jgi:UDP-glucuronate 4-epimerase
MPIKVFNHGDLMRDFTYVDDIVDGVNGVLNIFEKLDTYSILNIGNNTPTKLMDFISNLEDVCNKKAILENYPMQDGDVYQTFADVEWLKKIVGYQLRTDLKDGLREFVKWFKQYYPNN